MLRLSNVEHLHVQDQASKGDSSSGEEKRGLLHSFSRAFNITSAIQIHANKQATMKKIPESSATTSLALLVATYKYHVIYSSLYVLMAVWSWQAATKLLQNNAAPTTTTYVCVAIYYLITGLAALALKSELSYVMARRGLPPGDSGPLPLVGCFFQLLSDPQAFFVARKMMYCQNPLSSSSTMSTVNIFQYPTVIVSSDEDVQWVSTLERKGIVSAHALPHLKRMLGEESIMVKSGDEHKRLRKVFEPAFTPLAIRDYASTMDTIAQERLAKWEAAQDFQGPREWALLAMKIFFVCAFGSADEAFMTKLAHLFENWMDGFRAIVPFNIPGTQYARGLYFKNELGKLLKEMIEDFKAQNPPESQAAQKSVMGRLCYAVDEDGNTPTEAQLVDNLRFFLFAGFDTTKGSFGGISHFLKQNPKAEAFLAEEVQKFPMDGPLDVDQIKNEAPILNAVLAETWRLTAPLDSHPMVLNEDVEYKGYFMPKGCKIATEIQGYNAANHERFPRADEFHFERWLSKEHPLYDPAIANKDVIDYNVMNVKFRSFNMGSHMCLGGHFAKLEVRIVLIRLLQKYRFEIRNESVNRFPIKQFLNDFKITKRETQ